MFSFNTKQTPLQHNISVFAIIVASFCFVGYLLSSSYFSQVHLQKLAFTQAHNSLTGKAKSLNSFFNERQNDLRRLAIGEVINSYFINKDMNMSLEYGLKASQVFISKQFKLLDKTVLINEKSIYERLTLFDSNGEIIVDFQDKEHDFLKNNLAKIISVTTSASIMHDNYNHGYIMIVAPVNRLNKIVGWVVGWIKLENIHQHLSHSNQFLNGYESETLTFTATAFDNYVFLHSKIKEILLKHEQSFFENLLQCKYYDENESPVSLIEISTDTPFVFEGLSLSNKKEDFAAFRVALPNYNISLVRVTELKQIINKNAPRNLLITLAFLSLMLLIIVYISIRHSIKSHVLAARLDESEKKQTEITSVNENLQQEVEQRKQTEKLLCENEENLRITLDSIGDAVISTDINGNIARMNPVAEHLTGYSIDDAMGRYILEVFNVINSETRKKGENPIEKILNTGHAVELANHTVLIAKNGTERQIADAGTPIFNDEGKLVGTVLVFRDVTDQYMLTERLHQSEKMQAIGQLAGGIAHDFNNMLGGIIGSAELLDMRLKKEQTKCHKSVQLIIKMAQRASSLTDKLLAFSRKGKRIEIPVNFHVIIKDTVAILERSIDKRIHIELNLDAVSPIVLGDPSQLQNAILNLGVNARDAMCESGTLTISTKNVSLDNDYCSVRTSDLLSGYYIQITVSDTGHGIPHELHKKIFEPFFTTKKTGQGTGLGLSAVYGTLRDHQGDISIYSEKDDGTSFHLYLPVIEESVRDEKQFSREQQHGSGGILIVDDEEVIRTTTCKILKNLGYDVFSAEDGEQGVEAYKENKEKIDLVILDMIMPKMNGEEAFNAIFSINPEVKIIITSGFSHDIKVQQLQAKNDNIVFIKKPFHASELSELIATKLVKR